MTNKEVVLGFFEALDGDDFATAKKLLGSHHQLHSPMSPVPLNAEQHLGVSKAMKESFTNGRHEIVEVMETGNKVVLRGIWHATHTGLFNGGAASGKSVHLTFITIVEVENNEMKNEWNEMDAMSLMMQIGALPAPTQ